MDTREWKEYRIGDIFFQNRGDESAPNQNEEGEIIMINETRDNNGMTRKVEAKSIFNENAITISINFASIVFYQPIKFCASVNIAILRNKNLNKYNSLFLCSVLKETWKRYDYGYKISKDRINNTIILLPTTPDNQPDWQFMEDFIKKIYNKVIEEVKASAPALLSLSLSLSLSEKPPSPEM